MDAWLLIYEKVPRWTGDIAAAAARDSLIVLLCFRDRFFFTPFLIDIFALMYR